MKNITHELRRVLTIALDEDRGFGDLTSASIFSDETGTGTFTSKNNGILCGADSIAEGYGLIDPKISVELFKSDGDKIEKGTDIARVSGPVQYLLTGERIILNLIQHLSGIASSTSEAVKRLSDPSIKLCDTRKTLPGLRMLQKYAVRTGGGFNHRFRLDDGVMIKDNHIAASGSIHSAVKKVRDKVGPLVKIEVETENSAEVKEAAEAGADVIMLDNKSPDEVRSLRELIPNHIQIEVSGGITPETIASYHDCGADYISMGSLTHSVQALDISFNLEGGKK
jgi:nicotinate-nucleotide pyrophosphorylase (carboxylating)